MRLFVLRVLVLVGWTCAAAELSAGPSQLIGGECKFEIRLPKGWRLLAPTTNKFEITDMNHSERVRGEIVPKGRHLIQVNCTVLNGSYAEWRIRAKEELHLSEPVRFQEQSIFVGQGIVSAEEGEFSWGGRQLQSSYWLISYRDLAIQIHLFGWSDAPGREAVKVMVRMLLKSARISRK